MAAAAVTRASLPLARPTGYSASESVDADVINTIVSLVSGAAGGNIAGAVLKNLSLGTLWNSVAGIVGGGLGGKILGMLIPSLGAVAASKAGGAGIDIGAIIGLLAGGGVGGGALMAIIGVARSVMAK